MKFTIDLTTFACNGRSFTPDLSAATNETVTQFVVAQLSRNAGGRANTAVQNAKAAGKPEPADRGLAEAQAWLENGLAGVRPVRVGGTSVAPRTREDLEPIAERNVALRVANAVLRATNPRGPQEKAQAYNKRIADAVESLGADPASTVAMRAVRKQVEAAGKTATEVQLAPLCEAWLAKRGYTSEAVEAELDSLCLKHGIGVSLVDDDLLAMLD